MPIFVPAGSQFKVSPTPAPGSQNPHPDEEGVEIAPLPATGGFVVFWQGNYDPDFFGTEFRRFDANALPVGDYSGQPGGGQNRLAMDVVALNDGSFMTFSISGSHPKTISGLRFDSSGDQIGTFSITPPPTTGIGDLAPNSVVAAVPASGGFILSWAQLDDRVYWQQFDNAGQALTPIMQIAPTPNTTPQSVSVSAFHGGGYAIAYSEIATSGSTRPEHIILKTFNAQWQPVATVDIASRTPSGLPIFHTDVLANDRLILVWSDSSSVHAQLFDAQGVKIGGDILVSAETSPTVDVAAHPDGGFVISWTDPSDAGKDPSTTPVDNSSSSIKAQAFDASGNKVGDEILVNTVTDGPQTDQDIAILPNGDMVITWETPDPSLPPGDTRDDIAARLFRLVGGSGTSISGTEGDDVLVGTNGDDTIFGLGGNDQISGLAGADALYGGAGDDHLISGPPGDAPNYLVGGPGNDEYVVDLGDAVVEKVGEGFDTIRAQTNFVLNEFAEIELLSTTDDLDTASIFLIGNEFDQTLRGNAGNNYLDGAGGANILIGLGGNDTMIVKAGDTVVEAVGGGFDNVAARTSYVLAPDAEVEVLSTADHGGTDPITLVGNGFAQSLIGNNGNNYLDGGGAPHSGANDVDILQGRGGNDVMLVYPGDVVRENVGEGFDWVVSRSDYILTPGAEVEVLMTTDQASTQALNLTGNEFGQVVAGNEGANQLDGKLGNDLLLGFGGADAFIFSARFGNDNIDTIGDMVSGVDQIWLSNSIFTGLASGALPESAFRIGTAAQDADDRIIYDPATGNLLFDSDGAGGAAALHFAILRGAPTIAASDFLVIGH
jgi:Ca2+-binding RTX toxin-like protein